jgi:hypothetical protein
MNAKKLLAQPAIFGAYFLAALAIGHLTLSAIVLRRLYEFGGWPDETKAINCWAFAVPKWLRAGPADSYVSVRISKHTDLVPHIFFVPSLADVLVEEAPPRVPLKGWRGFTQSFWHKTRVRKGRGEELHVPDPIKVAAWVEKELNK